MWTTTEIGEGNNEQIREMKGICRFWCERVRNSTVLSMFHVMENDAVYISTDFCAFFMFLFFAFLFAFLFLVIWSVMING